MQQEAPKIINKQSTGAGAGTSTQAYPQHVQQQQHPASQHDVTAPMAEDEAGASELGKRPCGCL